MREIKFKVWDKNSKQMSIQTIGPSDWGDYLIDFKDGAIDIAAEYCEWLQYTGLKDMNGVEMYEGDVFDSLEGRYLVRWFNGDESCPDVGSSMNYPELAPAVGFGFERLSGDWDYKDFKWCYFTDRSEVIGNIYENPELLSV